MSTEKQPCPPAYLAGHAPPNNLFIAVSIELNRRLSCAGIEILRFTARDPGRSYSQQPTQLSFLQKLVIRYSRGSVRAQALSGPGPSKSESCYNPRLKNKIACLLVACLHLYFLACMKQIISVQKITSEIFDIYFRKCLMQS